MVGDGKWRIWSAKNTTTRKAHESVKLKERQLIWTKELINDPKHCFSQKRIDTNKTNISKIKIQVEKHRHGLITF